MTGGQPVDTNLDAAMIARQVRAEGVEPHRHRLRRAGEISGRCRLPARRHLPPSRRHPGAPEGADGRSRRLRPDLRPDLRRREAPPPQARRISRSEPARLHQRAGLRRLRRLRRQVQLRRDPAGRNPVRSQAADRPVGVQQGLFLPEGLLPELRDGRGRRADQGPAEHQAPRRYHAVPGPAGARAAAARRAHGRSSSPASAAPAS